jgi:hypothetical protein
MSQVQFRTEMPAQAATVSASQAKLLRAPKARCREGAAERSSALHGTASLPQHGACGAEDKLLRLARLPADGSLVRSARPARINSTTQRKWPTVEHR